MAKQLKTWVCRSNGRSSSVQGCLPARSILLATAGWLAGWVSAPSMHTSRVQGLSFLDLSTCTGITHVHVDLASYSTCMCLKDQPTRESPIYVHIDLHRSNSSFHNLLFILPDSSIGTGTGTRDVLSSPSFSSSLVALNMSTS